MCSQPGYSFSIIQCALSGPKPNVKNWNSDIYTFNYPARLVFVDLLSSSQTKQWNLMVLLCNKIHPLFSFSFLLSHPLPFSPPTSAPLPFSLFLWRGSVDKFLPVLPRQIPWCFDRIKMKNLSCSHISCFFIRLFFLCGPQNDKDSKQ